LEAGLYARFLGYDVLVYEQGELAQRVRDAGQTRMNTPFGQNRTTLGLAAIQAQEENYQPPANQSVLTWQEWLENYLLPLSQTDLLADHLRLNTTVLRVEQLQSANEAQADEEEGGGAPSFRVVSRDSQGQELAELFHGVLDCLGGHLSLPGCHVLDAAGYDQIRKVFTIIGDRGTLDLYSSAGRLIR
jgi:hypothetical protein